MSNKSQQAKPNLWQDQYGNLYMPKREGVSGIAEHLSIPRGSFRTMYRDRPDGTTARVGYVAGGLWLTGFRAERIERPV